MYCHLPVGEDYQTNSRTVNFETGDDPPCLNVVIVDDSERESCETFALQLSTSDSHVSLSPATVTATIYDDEGLHLSIFTVF